MSTNPCSTPASLSSLPLELQSVIFSHINPTQKEGIILARVSKRFRVAAEPYIWRHLAISTTIPDREGASAKEQQVAIASRVTSKLKGMMEVGNERRWGYVKEASVVPTAGALHATVMVLDRISPTLKSLTLQTARHDNYPEWIDIRLTTCGIPLSFPSLTHVRIELDAIHMSEFMLLLCKFAPNLAVLDIVFSDASEPIDEEGLQLISRFPFDFDQDTAIRELRLSYDEVIGKDLRVWEQHPKIDPFENFILLIQSSPHLTILSLIYDTGCEFPVDDLGPIVSQLTDLKDLDWPLVEMGDVKGDKGLELYPRLRRLAIGGAGEILPQGATHPMPALETLVIDYSLQHGDWDEWSFDFSYNQLGHYIPSFGSWVASHPLLHNLYCLFKAVAGVETHVDFDRIQRDGTPTGIIRSLSHQDEILIQISLRFRYNSTSASIDETRALSDGSLELGMAIDESEGRLAFAPGLVWKTFTIFNGMEVPAEIWDDMREVEGASEQDWNVRGVEVGAETWRILEDWRDWSHS